MTNRELVVVDIFLDKILPRRLKFESDIEQVLANEAIEAIKDMLGIATTALDIAQSTGTIKAVVRPPINADDYPTYERSRGPDVIERKERAKSEEQSVTRSSEPAIHFDEGRVKVSFTTDGNSRYPSGHRLSARSGQTLSVALNHIRVLEQSLTPTFRMTKKVPAYAPASVNDKHPVRYLLNEVQTGAWLKIHNPDLYKLFVALRFGSDITLRTLRAAHVAEPGLVEFGVKQCCRLMDLMLDHVESGEPLDLDLRALAADMGKTTLRILDYSTERIDPQSTTTSLEASAKACAG